MSAVLGQILAGGAGSLVESVGKVIDDLHTSDKERMDAENRATELDNQLALGQIDVNKAEAQHASLFVAGGRPAIIWVCAIALGLIYIPQSIVKAWLWTYQSIVAVQAWNGVGVMPTLPAYPDMGTADLVTLLLALLGMGAMRHRETMSGTARSEPLNPFPLPSIPNPFKRKPAEQEAP